MLLNLVENLDSRSKMKVACLSLMLIVTGVQLYHKLASGLDVFPLEKAIDFRGGCDEI